MRLPEETTRGSVFEIVGAWLGVWTPRHNVIIPPRPSLRTVALVTAGVIVLAAGVYLAVAPGVRDAKRADAAAQQRADERRLAAERRRVRTEARPRTGRLEPAGRGAMLADLGALIGADARERFDPDARTATCRLAPGASERTARVAYNCFSATADIIGAGAQEGARGVLSIPYRAVVDFEARRYTFCKLNPPPGEKFIPDPRRLVELPAACRVAA